MTGVPQTISTMPRRRNQYHLAHINAPMLPAFAGDISAKFVPPRHLRPRSLSERSDQPADEDDRNQRQDCTDDGDHNNVDITFCVRRAAHGE